MKKQTSTILASVLCFLVLVMCYPTNAQQIRTSQYGRGQEAQKTGAVTPQEKSVRAVYSKLTALNRASNNLSTTDESLDGGKVIKFELSNFHIGPIGEILSKPHNEFVTGFAGELIAIGRQVSVHNKGPEHVAFSANWAEGQYASAYEPQWSVAQVFAFYPEEYYDIGSYASYEVTVTLRERTRHYKALALFSKAFHQHNEISPKFWDFVVGSGSWLDRMLDEKRPPKEPMPNSSPPLEYESPTSIQSASMSTDDGTALIGDSDSDPPELVTEPEPEPASMTESTEEGLSSMVVRTTDNRTEHLDGLHGQTVGFQGECTSHPGFEERCVVNVPLWNIYENGTVNSAFFLHRWFVDEKSESATGPLNSTISCWAAKGIAVSSCFLGSCTVVGSLTGAGTEVRMTGGNVWNGQLAHKHSCRLPGGGTNCTTPGVNGSCPPGTVSDGFGMCCARLLGSDGTECGLEFLRCHPSTGIFNPMTCECVPNTPIVVDINGNGIDLTNAADGVDFDLNGDGVRDHLSWTRENSDDAWLALDRNGNNTIDTGAELFGNFTQQPAGQKKNGFLALAEFDKQANGGNGDGLIDQHDAVFSSLRLWQDTNHDGVSQAAELQTPGALNIKSLALDFKESKKTDEFGNEFRYRAKVNDTKAGSVGRWAWDVFLTH